MKHRIFILSVVSAALIIFGCGQEGLVSPQLTQSDQGTVLAKATVTSFTATADFTAGPTGGTFTVTNGVLHIRGQMLQGPITGGLGVGTAAVVNDADIFLATNSGPGRGTLTVVTGSVTYQGRFDGQFNGPVFLGHFQAQGTDGSKINGSFTDQAVDNMFVLTGRLVNP